MLEQSVLPVRDRWAPVDIVNRLLEGRRLWLAWACVRLFGILALLYGIPPYRNLITSNGDIPLYWGWAHLMWAGAIPYTSVTNLISHDVVYPPGIIPFLALPAANVGLYSAAFLILALVADACVQRMLRTRQIGSLLWLVGPIALGPLFLGRLDIFIAAMLVAALVSIERGRFGRAGFWIGWAALLKIWPIVLLLLFLRRVPAESRRRFLGIPAAAIAASIVPFLVVGGWAGLKQVLTIQSSRSVEFESLFAVPLYALQTAGRSVHIYLGAANQFEGPAVAIVADLSAAIFGLGIAYCLYRFARGQRPDRDVACWLLLVVAVILLTSKVLSPQYFVWALAAVCMVVDTRRDAHRLAGVTLLMLLVTQLQFPFEYWQMYLGTVRALPISVFHAATLIAFASLAIRAAIDVRAGAPTFTLARNEGRMARAIAEIAGRYRPIAQAPSEVP